MGSDNQRKQDEDASSPDLEALLEYLRTVRGFDFTGYRRTGLGRRIGKRVSRLGLSSFGAYQDYLEVHPGEFAELFDTILINVTGFYRDEAPWQYLQGELVPALAAEKHADEPIRVWSAGCATGQEAYTVIMVLAEVLGPEQARHRAKVYATDVDDGALERARQARYSAREVEDVPPEQLERYFERSGSGFAFDQDLRRSVIFGRHDLTRDAPISRVDLLLCRNTLMYLNAETQASVLDRLHFALREGGVLLLGKAEMLLSHANLFTPIDLQCRVFRKVARATLRGRLLAMADSHAGHGQPERARPGDRRLPLASFQSGPEAQVVVDVNGLLAAVNDRARMLFRVAPSDIGRPFHDLDLSFRPVELRSKIQHVYAERRPVVVRDVEWPGLVGGLTYLDVQVVPMADRDGRLLGASVTFTDVSRYRQLREKVEHANRELETTVEELQSTVEELETTNEELQTINDELSQRTGELDEVNAYLESILSSFRGGVVVLDEDLRVRVWNHLSGDLWGLRPEEAQGRHFLDLDIGLPVGRMRHLLHEALNGGGQPLEDVLDAVNRRGRPVRIRVTCNALRGSAEEVRGVFVLMNEEPSAVGPAAGERKRAAT
jgi:two-component system CheB/CheR fusion protein